VRAAVVLLLLWPGALVADEARASKPKQVAAFLAGGAVGLGAHEGAHLTFDYVFDAKPDVHRVSFGPIPFFAISPTAPTTPRQRFLITSAGFVSQHVSSEWMLTRHPRLRQERGAFAKGWLTFNVLTSVAYAGAAFGGFGPVERDTRGIAESSGIDEPLVGAFILVPAALDTYRFYRPEARWARWASRGAKVGFMLLALGPKSGPRAR
jgi:hypothetical protein